MREHSRDGVTDALDHWPPGPRSWWWVTPEDRDREADAADDAADLRDEQASRRDAEATDLDQTAADREQEATTRLTAAHRRLTRAEHQDTDRLAAALAAVEAARAFGADTEDPDPGLLEAEAACEAETVQGIGNGIERRATREELGHAVQHLAASASNRRAAARNRSDAQADRQAASDDRGSAKTDRRQSALYRAADPDLALYRDR